MMRTANGRISLYMGFCATTISQDAKYLTITKYFSFKANQ